MAVFGWICMVLLLIWLSLGLALVAFNGLGKYNIGGVPNKAGTKAMIFAAIVCWAVAWVKVLQLAPFTLIFA